MGQAFACAKCGKPVPVTDANSREMTQAERDVRLFLDEEEPPPAPRPILPAATLPPSEKASHDESDADDVPLTRIRDIAPGAPRRPPPVLSPKPPSGAAAAEASRFVQKGGPAGAKVPRCARCHRPFRGHWDQIETDEGALCHICANKIDNFVLGAAPDRPKTGEHSVLVQEIARQHTWTEPPPAAADPTDFERRRRHVVILGAVVVLTITVALLIPEGGLYSAGPAETPRELPPSFAHMVNALLHVAAYAMAIYFTLVMAQKLRNEALLANIVAVSMVAALVYAVNLIVPLAGYILGLVVVYLFYELSIPYLFMLIIFGILAEMCTAALGALIFGTMGMLVR